MRAFTHSPEGGELSFSEETLEGKGTIMCSRRGGLSPYGHTPRHPRQVTSQGSQALLQAAAPRTTASTTRAPAASQPHMLCSEQALKSRDPRRGRPPRRRFVTKPGRGPKPQASAGGAKGPCNPPGGRPTTSRSRGDTYSQIRPSSRLHLLLHTHKPDPSTRISARK